MCDAPCILVAEDEPAIRDGLSALLESEGYFVETAADGEEALRIHNARRLDLILLDVMMPRLNGYAACVNIRRTDPDIPIIFLTVKDGEADELRGLSSGADDYISKTAPEAVMLARIAAALRRARASSAAASFSFGRFRVDAAQMRLFSEDGAICELSPREVAILRHFAMHPGEVLSRDSLITRFWGVDFEGEEATLTVAMHRLRAKLGGAANLIETVSRQGYRFVGP